MRSVYRILGQLDRYASWRSRPCSLLSSYQTPKLDRVTPDHLCPPSQCRPATSSAIAAVDHNERRDLDYPLLIEEFLEQSPAEIEPVAEEEGAHTPPPWFLANVAEVPARLPRERGANVGPVSSAKWQFLKRDYRRLLFECDVASHDPKSARLVDYPENENDVELWSHILAFRHRRDGNEGVAAVLQGLHARKSLWAVDGEAAISFWHSLLNVALRDQLLLESAWEYAEWMYEVHGARWPNLYQTTMSAFICSGEEKEAIRWHVRLSPNFGLAAPDFVVMLRRYITDPDPTIQDTLKSIYRLSTHRRLYDSLIPYLHTQGTQALARKWRVMLLYYNDVPASLAARPFLRFLASYFPRDIMVRPEFLAAGIEEPAKYWDGVPGSDAEVDSDFQYFINGLHGRTFGIREKTYNDSLGARLFASSWIPLDMAVRIVRILGVDRIGPLSLQSIALREWHSDRILHRLDQLEMFGISTGTSSYTKALRHFAAVEDHEALADLLQSDMHPDVFDDFGTQRRILASAIVLGDWKKYRLILAVRLAVSLDSVTLASNALLPACLESGNKQLALRVLEDMGSRGVQVFPSTSNAISVHIIRNVWPHVRRGPAVDLPFYASLCRHIMAMNFPLATRALRTVLFKLAREGHMDELERLSMEILQRYRSSQNAERATLHVHKLDVPNMLSEDAHNRTFELLPRGLSLGHHLHPVQLIFDKELQHCVVRSTFLRATLFRAQPDMSGIMESKQPADFGLARGVRVMALWREMGVYINPPALRKAVQIRLADLFEADWQTNRRLRTTARGNLLSLEEAKLLCDEAWGAELLPPMADLREAVKKLGTKRTERWHAFLESKVKAKRTAEGRVKGDIPHR